MVEELGQVAADWLVEAETATIEGHLIDVLCVGMLALAMTLFRCRQLTAHERPRNKPLGPSFFTIVATPCKTPRYIFGASFFACSSPCNCNLSRGSAAATPGTRRLAGAPNLYGLKAVSDGDGAACGNAACYKRADRQSAPKLYLRVGGSYPKVVDMAGRALCFRSLRRRTG